MPFLVLSLDYTLKVEDQTTKQSKIVGLHLHSQIIFKCQKYFTPF